MRVVTDPSPRETALDKPAQKPEKEVTRSLGTIDVMAVVIGGIIGVGIFFTPGTVARDLPTPTWVLGIWILAVPSH